MPSHRRYDSPRSRRHRRSPRHASRSSSLHKRETKSSRRRLSPEKRAWKFDSPPRDESQGFSYDDHLNVAGVLGLSCEQQKAARELYVGNLPPNLDVNQLIDFFNAAMLTLNSSGIPGNPVSRAWIAADGHFAFVEFRTIEEATIALQLNGLNCMGYTLRIGRPKTYPVEYSALLTSTRGIEPVSPAAALAAATAAAASVGVNSVIRPLQKKVEKSERLILLDLPAATECPEKKVKEHLQAYGTLKIYQYFEIPKDDHTSATGVCIFEYAELDQQKALTKAVQKDQFNLKVRVMPAEQAIHHLTEAMEKAGIKEVIGGDLMRPQVPTRVIMLTNIVTCQELLDDQEFFDIVDDIKIECSQFGEVQGVEIPRPGEVDDDRDIGYAYVKFRKLQEAGAARKALSGRKFASRTVEAHYFSEKKFNQKLFKNPEPNFDLDGRMENPPTKDQ